MPQHWGSRGFERLWGSSDGKKGTCRGVRLALGEIQVTWSSSGRRRAGALSLLEGKAAFELAASIYHMLGNAEMSPSQGHAEQCAACHWLPSQGRIFTSQGASLDGSTFIESLGNPTNFEEKSLCSQAAGASCGVCEARRGMPPSMHSSTGGTAQCRKPPLFATRDYSDNFREVTGVPSSSHPLAVPRVAAKPHLYQDIWLVPLRAKALLTT